LATVWIETLGGGKDRVIGQVTWSTHVRTDDDLESQGLQHREAFDDNRSMSDMMMVMATTTTATTTNA